MIDKKREFQRIKSMTTEHFWDFLERLNTQAYEMGKAHVKEAMQMHPRITKPMIEQVMAKVKDVQKWDGLWEVQE